MKYITPYNHDWPNRYIKIAEYLKGFLPDICRFHHVGSTSVPGMPAKDIIDLDIEYVQGSLQAVIDGLKEAGYEHEGDFGITGREAFRTILRSKAASLPVHHLYACEVDTDELSKHLAFRDYLRRNPARAEWLATQKHSVAASANSRDEYIEKKSCFYTAITEESLEWANNAT